MESSLYEKDNGICLLNTYKNATFILQFHDKYSSKAKVNPIGKGHKSNQELRAELPFKTPLEFLDNQNTDIIPPKGVALWDVQERIKHLKYIQVCVKKDKKTEDQNIDDGLIKKIDKNINHYQVVLAEITQQLNPEKQGTSKKKVTISKSEIKKQNINVPPTAGRLPIQLSSAQYKKNAFDTPHHTAVMVEGKVIFEIRDYMLNKDGKLLKKDARANIEEIYNEKVVVYRKNFSFKTFGKNGKRRTVWTERFATKKTNNVASPINSVNVAAHGYSKNNSSDTEKRALLINEKNK